jgi:hypothetical protein
MAIDKSWKNPYSKYPVVGRPHTVAQTVSRNVFIFGRGAEYDGIVIRAEVQDLEARDDKGYLIPPVIVLPCPRCSKGLKIDGIAKGVSIEYFERPRKLDLREIGFGIVDQVAVVSVREDMGCAHPGDGAPCGARFRIQENVLSKIG